MRQTGNGTSPHRNQTVWRGNKKLESADKRVQPVDDASKTLCKIEKGAEQMSSGDIVSLTIIIPAVFLFFVFLGGEI